MNRDTDRNVLQRKRIAQIGRSSRTTVQSSAYLQADRRDDITLLAIFIFQQSQTRGANRIILNRGDLRLDAVPVPAEINCADFLLVALATTATRHATIMIASTRFLAGVNQALLRLGLRDLVIIRDGDISRRRR